MGGRNVDRVSISCGDVANVEAHITGTVWKIEVAVGDPSTRATRS